MTINKLGVLIAKTTQEFFIKCVPDLSDGKSVEPMKFREPVPIRTGPHSPKEKEKNKLATIFSLNSSQ